MKIQINFPGILNNLNGIYTTTEETLWIDLLQKVLGTYYYYLFETDHSPKAFIFMTMNGTKASQLQELKCRSGDHLQIFSAQSGG